MPQKVFTTSAMLLFLSASGIAQAAQLDLWERRDSPAPTAVPNTVVYGNGITIATAIDNFNLGRRLISTNGDNWVTLPETWVSFSAMAFGNGIFVHSGGFYTVATSTNGLNWTPVPAGEKFIGVWFAGDRFFGKLSNDQVKSSTNGINWVTVPLPNGTELSGIAYGAGSYVVVSGTGTILASTNTVDWNALASVTTNSLNAVTFGDGKFVAVGKRGEIRVSTDAALWSPAASGTTVDLYSIAFGDGRFVVLGKNGTFLVSTNGTSWQISPNSSLEVQLPNYSLFRAVTHTPNGFVAVGESLNGNGTMAKSDDGIIWRQIFGTLRTVTRGDNLFVAAGEMGRLCISADGKSWTNNSIGIGGHFFGSAYGMGRFIAVGGKGVISISTNVVNWESQMVGTNDLVDVAIGTNLCVAVGSRRTVLTSTNGSAWHPVTVAFPGTNLAAVAYGEKGFVIGGNIGDIAFSPDGENWVLPSKPTLSNPSITYNSAVYGQGKYIMVGDRATIVSSLDGTNWVSRYPQNVSNSNNLECVVYANGLFVATGRAGEVFFSSNGDDWRISRMETNRFQSTDSIYGLAGGNGALVAVGITGRIMRAGDLFTLAAQNWTPNGGLELNLKGQSGRTYQIQTSSNFTDWADAFAVTNTFEATPFVDVGGTNRGSRFYRAAILP